jgi:hypothetical protein
MRTPNWLQPVAITLLFAGPDPRLAAADLAADERAARDYAKPRVFAVNTDKGNGTAVLLKVDPGGPVGYFATCYHVLHGTTWFKIYPSGGAGDEVAGVAGTEILARPSIDLVLIKAKLPAGGDFKPLDPFDPNGLASDDDRDPIDGFVFGVAGVQSRQMYTTGVRIQQIEWADLLPGVVDTNLRKRGAPRLQVRLLGREVTYAGMSGGLVVDRDRRFGGLLLGRMPEPNAIPVMITAPQVRALLDESARGGWTAYAPKDFAAPPPYQKEVLQRMLEPWPVSEIGWNTYDAWVRAFESDPLQFLKAFQEVRLDLRELQSFTRDPKNEKSDKLQVRLHGDRQVRLLLNGVPWVPDDPATLQPGENLLIISKPPDGGGRYDLTDLLRPNPFDVTFHLGETADTVYHLKRSLPRVIQGYSVYVTIENGLPGPGHGYSARLAVPLDYLEEVINQTPFSLPFGDRDPRTGSEFLGAARPTGDLPVKLTYVSPQTLDVAAEIGIEVKKAQANFVGVRVAVKPQSATIRMTGRVQFPASPRSLFFVCARAMAASGAEKQFLLPLFGDELTVDASGLLRELLVCYTNTRLLRPNDPRTPGPDEIHGILRSSGLVSEEADWRLDPARIQLVPDERSGAAGKAWVVVTFRLLHKGKPVEVRKPPPLLPDPKVRDALAGEFVTAGVPVAGLSALHPSVVGPTGLPRVRGAGMAEVGPFDLRLALDRVKPARREEVKLSENAAELSAEIGKAVAAGLARSRVTGEVRWGGWQSAGGPTAEDVRLAVTLAPGGADPGQVVGTVSVGRAEVKTEIGTFMLTGVKGEFKLTVDPKSDDRAYHFRITTSAGKYAVGMDTDQDLPKFDFDVWISRDGKTLKHNFGDRFLFGKRGK